MKGVPRRIWIAGAALLLLAIIAFIPLRVAVGGQAVSARKVDGIIWAGSVRDLRIASLAIGDVNAGLRFWPLLIGRATMDFERGDAAFSAGIRGSVTRRGGGYSINNLNAAFPLSQIFSPLPFENLALQDFSARFHYGRCVEASGSIRLSLGGSIPGIDVTNGLIGKPRCDRGDLLLPLISQSAMEHVDIRIKTDGSYNATVFLEGDRGEYAPMLGLSGFRSIAGGYRFARKGRL
ncbi:MAG: type II secretion system protein N [Sphingorhabdus sp.]